MRLNCEILNHINTIIQSTKIKPPQKQDLPTDAVTSCGIMVSKVSDLDNS